MSYREIGSADRMKQCLAREESGSLQATDISTAAAQAAARLGKLIDSKGAGVIAGIASAHATNEDLYTFRRFLAALGSETSGVAAIQGQRDSILIQSEKAANGAGARAIGFGDAAAVCDRINSGAVDAVIVLGHDLLHESLLGGEEPLAGLDTVIVLDTHVSSLQRVAHVMFPVRHAAEKHGTFVNVDGRAQRLTPAVEPAWDAYSDGEVLAQIGAAMGLEGFDGQWEVGAVSRALAAEYAAFAGVDLESVGDAGRPLVAPGSGTAR